MREGITERKKGGKILEEVEEGKQRYRGSEGENGEMEVDGWRQ